MHMLDEQSKIMLLRTSMKQEDEIIADLMLACRKDSDDSLVRYLSQGIGSLVERRGLRVEPEKGQIVAFDYLKHVSSNPIHSGDLVRVETPGVIRKDGSVVIQAIVSRDINSPEWQEFDRIKAEKESKRQAEEKAKKAAEDAKSRQVSSEVNVDRAAFNMLMQMQQAGKAKRK